VKAEDLNIDLKENILTLDGDVKKPEGNNEVELLTEYKQESITGSLIYQR
jgi:HSP20 family molecular chaperone IbpA